MNPPSAVRLAVLASGGGSNLQALLDYLQAHALEDRIRVVWVASDREQAHALVRARTRGIEATWLDTTGRTTGLLAELTHRNISHVVLAGYLRLVPGDVVAAYRGRMVNIHPSLLPHFGGPGMYGHRVHEAVLRSGHSVSGATVHLVDEVYDRGAILARATVPVLPGDTSTTLAERVLAAEHRLYPPTVVALVLGHLTGSVPPPASAPLA